MNCKNCNSELPGTAKFCAVCGTPVEQQPAAPAAPAAVCRSCGNAIAQGVKFCNVCGTAVEAPAAAQPVVPAAPVPPVPPVAPVAVPQPVEPVAPVAAPQPVEPVAPVAAPQPVEPVAPVAAPQPVEPVAPVAAPQPVEPVAPVAAPQPVEPVAPVAAPQPVEPVAPAAAPQPVEPVAPVAAPQPMNDVMPQPVAPSYTAPTANNIDMDIAGLDMDAASVAAAKPVKKSKLGLWIGLGAVGVVGVAAAVCGLFFRGPVANLFMGDSKYATMIEGKVFEEVMNTENEDVAEISTQMSDAFSSVLTSMNTAYDEYDSSDDVTSAFAGIDLEDIISTYNAAFVEVYGADGVTMNLDADLQLTDTAMSDLGATEDIIDIINASKLTLSYQAGKDALGMEISATDPEGFEISGRGVVNKDGTVAVMLPFGTDKCIKMTLDTEGNVTSAEEVDFEIDAAEIYRIGNEMADIYLKYYEMADITIEKGSMKAAKVEAEGRLITAEMDEDLLGDMIEEMITFMVEDDYFMDKFAEFMELAGEEYSEDELKDDMESEMETLKEDINFTLAIETLVDNNSNLLAKSYIMDIEDEGEASVTFVGGETEQGFVMVIDDMDVLTAKLTQESETNGKIEITIADTDTEIEADVAYENVQTVAYLNTETVTGKFDIEIKEEDNVMNIVVEVSADGSKMTNSFTVEMEELGTVSLTMDMIPENLDLTDIPADAVDFTNADSWTDDESMANAQYVLDALNEIKAKCESNSSSTFAGFIGDAVAEGVIYFEELLTPMVDSEQLSELADDISALMDELDTVYSENSAYVSDELFDECSDVYDELSDCYYDVAYEYEMEQSAYDEILADYNELQSKVADLCDRIRSEADEAKSQQAEQNTDLIGMWTAYMIEGYGEQMTAEEADFSMNVVFNGNGTYTWNWDGEITTGTWSVADGIVTLVEEEWYYEFEYVDGALTYVIDADLKILLQK